MSCFFNRLPVWLVLVWEMKNAFWPTFPHTDKDPNCALTSWYINLCQVSHNIISANEILEVLFSFSLDDRTGFFIGKNGKGWLSSIQPKHLSLYILGEMGSENRVIRQTKKTNWNIWKNPFEIESMWFTTKAARSLNPYVFIVSWLQWGTEFTRSLWIPTWSLLIPGIICQDTENPQNSEKRNVKYLKHSLQI